MPVADIVRLGMAPRMTNQQLADMALEADREARRYRKAGNHELAAEADRESAAIAALLK